MQGATQVKKTLQFVLGTLALSLAPTLLNKSELNWEDSALKNYLLSRASEGFVLFA